VSYAGELGLQTPTSSNLDPHMKKSLSALSLLGVAWVSGSPLSAPRIARIDQNTRTVERQAVTVPKIGQGMTRMIWLVGPWMDYVNDVNGNGGVDGTIKSTHGDFDNSYVQIILSAPASATPGDKTLSVDVKCPPIPFTDCTPGPFSFKVRVIETGPLTTITPNNIVAPNQQTTYTISGEGLNIAQLLPRLTTLKNAAIVSQTANTLVVSGTNPSCGGVDIEFTAIGGLEDIPYKKASGLSLPVAGGICGTNFSTSLITGSGTPGGPDLQAVAGLPVFRHIAPNRKVASEPFCHGMFAQATTAIVKTITVGDLVWGVKNTGGSAVTVPFRAQLRRGGVIVADEPVASLAAGASRSFTYHRAQSTTEVGRLAVVPNATSSQIYNATGGECVQTIGQDTQYDWQDPQWSITIDGARAVSNDINLANNTKSF
jgi:hypothetical protein